MNISSIKSVLSPERYYRPTVLLLEVLWRRRQLFWEMSRRDLFDRYVGQALGSFWAVLNPVLFMGVYLFVFSYVFRSRMPEGTGTGSGGWGNSYALYLLSGLIPWMGLQEVMSRSTSCITGNANLVKQIVFPEEILPLKIIVSALTTQCVALAMVGVYAWVCHGPPPLTVFLLPVLLFFEILLMAGTAMFFSALAPFFRDIKDLVGLLCFTLIYFMPIFFTPNMLSGWLNRLLRVNPLSHMIECWHDALYWGEIASPVSWAIYPGFSLLVFLFGCRLFGILKHLFGNVL